MSLMSEYGQSFSGDVKARGREYFRSGAVKITSHDAAQVKATVDGSSRYRVTVGWDDADDLPVFSCTCPFFEDRGGEPCKHCWATVLKANADGVLPKPPDWDEGGREAVVDDDDDNDNDDDDDEEDAYRSPIVVGFGAPPYNPHKRPHGKPHVNKSDPGAWRKQLNALTQSMRSVPVHAAQPLAWPPGRRILYIVDKPGTMEGRGLVIELAHETPKRDGSPDRPKQLKIGREQIASLPEPVDRQIVQMLLGARRGDYGYYGYYDSEAPRRFELPDSAYTTTLRLMCDTGRCRLRREHSEDRPPTIAWDDGPPWEFWLEVKPSPGGRYMTLEASLRRPVVTRGSAARGANPDASGNGDASGGSERNGEVPPNGQAAIGASSETGSGHRPTDVPAADVEHMKLSEPDLLVQGGLVFARGKVARLEHFDAFTLIIALREGMKLTVPLDQKEDLLKTLFSLPRLPRLDLPEDLRVEELRPAAKPRLTIKKPSKSSYYSYDERLVGTLSFDYDGQVVSDTDQKGAILTPGGHRVIHRDVTAEATARAKLYALGFREAFGYGLGARDSGLRLTPNKLPKVVAELTREGWHVEADGKLYRQPGEFKLNVKSGIDWFELHGEVSFGDVSAPLPRLLEALRKGETSVRLDDGTFGLLPQEWLKKYAGLAGLGEQTEDHLRFNKRQVGFLDALLSSMPEARFDETFSRARDELMRFGGIEPLDAPQTFQGELRAYQRDGLGWMAFLRKFGFGGCLADDMGLGKTVQVLALLEARRQLRQAGTKGDLRASDAKPGENGNGNGSANGNGIPHSTTPPRDHSTTPPTPAGPSLVVAPRSLIFNWKQEAARFCPELKVLDHTSVAREKTAGHFDQYDLILTTYGTLRRDMAFLKDVRFDYAVLDEAQAIKNSSSESAKAARLVQADHRLALSGTPVQNHLGELWSLFEFLNPGMMGAAGVFRDLTAGAAGSDPAARDALARALRPFILRRTKEQVARDLPEKLEQTVFCELEAEQRKLYNELRDHYRSSLLDRIAREGMNKAKIMVLEALLRLRQAACHPGLIDKKKSAGGSAKLDALMGHVADVIDEGHKVLVFSQFTSFLSIVRQRFDATKTPYEYLDGKTKDRQGRVERFQTDPNCKLFLISLKAGGLGLNLTAAEYVFLLDPWWNPAVEAQAIDRAHRIGQTQRVFAYRLIAKDTVEEKVLQLQQSKKELADAIINADNSLIRSLKREDLEMLLS
jgi:superfamily II DNA or RNA helicase